jgi:hypothetical protein
MIDTNHKPNFKIIDSGLYYYGKPPGVENHEEIELLLFQIGRNRLIKDYIRPDLVHGVYFGHLNTLKPSTYILMNFLYHTSKVFMYYGNKDQYIRLLKLIWESRQKQEGQ